MSPVLQSVKAANQAALLSKLPPAPDLAAGLSAAPKPFPAPASPKVVPPVAPAPEAPKGWMAQQMSDLGDGAMLLGRDAAKGFPVLRDGVAGGLSDAANSVRNAGRAVLDTVNNAGAWDQDRKPGVSPASHIRDGGYTEPLL